MWGLDHLGGAKYSSTAIKSFPAGWACGVFSNTFGDARPFIDKLLATGKCKAVRVHLAWKDAHNFSRKDFYSIGKEADRWTPLVAKYSSVDWYFSGACEHKLNSEDAHLLAEQVLRATPGWTKYVNTPMEGGAIIHGDDILNEVHGTAARRPTGDFLYSYDGSPCVDSNAEEIKSKFSAAKIFFWWTSQFNGRKTAKDSTPRPQRKAWPSGELIDSIAWLSEDKGRTTAVKKGVFKTHSDQHSVPPAPRELKPVIIVPQKGSLITLVAKDGTVIAKAPYFGSFDGGGYRYYLGQWGYKLAEKALEVSGSPVVKVKLDGKVLGSVNPGFRDWNYR